MRNALLITTLVLLAMAVSFAYAGFYCLNSGEPDLCEGLIGTFAVPFFFGSFIALAGFAATPVDREDRRQRSR